MALESKFAAYVKRVLSKSHKTTLPILMLFLAPTALLGLGALSEGIWPYLTILGSSIVAGAIAAVLLAALLSIFDG
jgi:predicted exporter